jgi:hypothetical protein
MGSAGRLESFDDSRTPFIVHCSLYTRTRELCYIICRVPQVKLARSEIVSGIGGHKQTAENCRMYRRTQDAEHCRIHTVSQSSQSVSLSVRPSIHDTRLNHLYLFISFKQRWVYTLISVSELVLWLCYTISRRL